MSEFFQASGFFPNAQNAWAQMKKFLQTQIKWLKLSGSIKNSKNGPSFFGQHGENS